MRLTKNHSGSLSVALIEEAKLRLSLSVDLQSTRKNEGGSLGGSPDLEWRRLSLSLSTALIESESCRLARGGSDWGWITPSPLGGSNWGRITPPLMLSYFVSMFAQLQCMHAFSCAGLCLFDFILFDFFTLFIFLLSNSFILFDLFQWSRAWIKRHEEGSSMKRSTTAINVQLVSLI